MKIQIKDNEKRTELLEDWEAKVKGLESFSMIIQEVGAELSPDELQDWEEVLNGFIEELHKLKEDTINYVAKCAE